MEEIRLLKAAESYAVVVKPRGMESEAACGKPNVPEALSRLLGCPKERIHPVHRLDQPTGGVMVYALTPGAAGALSRALQEGRFEKEYLAVCDRAPEEESGTWTDLLFWDSRARKAYTVKRERRGVREARLEYRVLRELPEGRALLRFHLLTGRTHQIRVQCASRGLPVAGDRRYGSRTVSKELGLWCETLGFPDPESGAMLRFSCPPPAEEPFPAPEDREKSFSFFPAS